jgi:iron complex transport system substrate-binding protein
MRIVSLLPSATEMLAALGLEGELVGVSHSCDYPPAVAGLPRVTRTAVPADASSGEIDRLVRELHGQGLPLYTLDRELLRRLAPDLVVTQGLCDVCAVPGEITEEAVAQLPGCPRVVSLSPHSLGAVLERRIESVAERAAGATRRRVTLLEWLDPLYAAGHWTPELVTLAGGIEGHGRAGQRSRLLDWADVVNWAPEVLVVACCGFSTSRTARELDGLRSRPGYGDLPAVRAGNVFLVDGGAYFSRPGPRLVDSLELLAHLLHPARFPSAPVPFLTLSG